MVDFKLLKTIGAIKNAKDDKNEDIFLPNEKGFFENPLIKNADDAQKVAELLVKIKDANSKRQKNDKLVSELDDERDKDYSGSLAYRVLNIDNLVRDTKNRLVFLGRSDLPTDKDKINEKIAELEKEISEERIKEATNDLAVAPIERELKGLIKDREEIRKNLKRRKNVVKVISGGDPKITFRGTERKLSEITGITVKDYSGNNLMRDNPPDITDNALNILNRATVYLNEIRDTKPDFPTPYRRTKMDNFFDNRIFQNRESIMSD